MEKLNQVEILDQKKLGDSVKSKLKHLSLSRNAKTVNLARKFTAENQTEIEMTSTSAIMLDEDSNMKLKITEIEAAMSDIRAD